MAGIFKRIQTAARRQRKPKAAEAIVTIDTESRRELRPCTGVHEKQRQPRLSEDALRKYALNNNNKYTVTGNFKRRTHCGPPWTLAPLVGGH